MTMGSNECLGHKAPHHGVETMVTQVLLPLSGNLFTPTAQQQITSVSQDKK